MPLVLGGRRSVDGVAWPASRFKMMNAIVLVVSAGRPTLGHAHMYSSAHPQDHFSAAGRGVGACLRAHAVVHARRMCAYYTPCVCLLHAVRMCASYCFETAGVRERGWVLSAGWHQSRGPDELRIHRPTFTIQTINYVCVLRARGLLLQIQSPGSVYKTVRIVCACDPASSIHGFR